jgi:2-dehydro-3-deoxygluconokinase
VPVISVDPVGAGDAFGAAYLNVLCRGGSLEERLGVAAAAGAFAVTVPGHWEGLPAVADLDLLGGAAGSVIR